MEDAWFVSAKANGEPDYYCKDNIERGLLTTRGGGWIAEVTAKKESVSTYGLTSREAPIKRISFFFTCDVNFGV